MLCAREDDSCPDDEVHFRCNETELALLVGKLRITLGQTHDNGRHRQANVLTIIWSFNILCLFLSQDWQGVAFGFFLFQNL